MPTFSTQSSFQPYQRRKPMGVQPGAQPQMGQQLYQRGGAAPGAQLQTPPMGQPLYQRGGAAPGAQLQAPQPMTQAGQIAQNRVTQGLQTGQFGEVQSAQAATDRASALRTSQALQAARGSATRGSLSTEAAQRAQDEAMAAANTSNLEAQNSVNQLQRQYGQDALTRADKMETDAYGRATNERDYQTGRMDLGYNRTTDESRYGDTRGDVMYDRGRQGMLDSRDESRYQDTRGDVQYTRGYQEKRDAVGDQRYDQQYSDNRGDVQYARGYQEKRDTVGDSRYADETTYSRGRDAVGDQRYDQQYQDSRGDVAYQRGYQENRDQVGDARYADETSYSRGRDATADQRYTDETTYSRGRDATADQRYDRTYADSRGDVNYSRDESKRLEGKGDIESLISSVTDPRAQNLLRTTQAKGGDVKAMYQQMMDNGTIKQEYRSATPGQQAYQASFDELAAVIPRQNTEDGRPETDEQYKSRIDGMIRNDYETSRAPLEQANQTRNAETAARQLASGNITKEALATLTPANIESIPTGSDDLNPWLAENKTGGWVNIGGTPLKVVGGDRYKSGRSAWGNDTHTDYTIFQTQEGSKYYRDQNGKWFDGKPGDKGAKKIDSPF